jgi:hypothetical protein
MSASAAQGDEQTRPSETVAGFLAAFAIFAGVISIGWHPLRLVLPAILIAMISAGMGGERRKRLTFAAVIITAACFFLGMTVSVVTQRPLW